jgi:hypothetical protein
MVHDIGVQGWVTAERHIALVVASWSTVVQIVGNGEESLADEDRDEGEKPELRL